MNDLISIIVPVYKVEKYLDDCVYSIINQTYSNLEIILVDDGSPDKCPMLCDMWQKRDVRIKVIHKLNGGLSDARNAGLKIAKGDYIAFVDSDDWIEPNMYEKLLSSLKEEDADICACGINSIYTNNQRKKMKVKSIVGNSEQILDLLYDDASFPVSAWNKLFKRSCWNNFEFPVGKICEDAYTTYQLIDKAKKIVQIEEALYNYRIREESIMTANFSHKRMDEENAWRCNYKFIEKNYPKLKKKSYDFYIQRVNRLIHTIPRNESAYLDDYNFLKNILKENIFYLIFSSKLKPKYRLKILIDYFRL